MKHNYITQFETKNNDIVNCIIPYQCVSDNTAKIEFITENGDCLSGNVYDMAMTKVTMGRFVPTKKFLNEIADTLAADMIDYVKNGGSVKKITASLVYDENSNNYEVN